MVQTEVLIIGGGPGGYVAALRAAQLGKQVTLVEADALGGVCLNRGCIPSKALIDVANSFYRLGHEAGRGIRVAAARVEMPEVQAWKERLVRRLGGGIARLLAARRVTVLQGRGRLTGPKTAVVEGTAGSEAIAFEACILATGAVPVPLPHLPYDREWVLSSTEVLDLTEIPRHLAVVGGGYIGLELGIAFRKLGSQVTVVEALDRLLPAVDPEVVRVLARSLDRLGIEVLTGTRALGRAERDGQPCLRVAAGEQVRDLPADRVLVTVGRRPASDQLGLEAAGVVTDRQGYVRVNSSLQTSVPWIYAIGDLTGAPLLAHKASREGLVAAERIAGRPAAMDALIIPAVVFTDPEIATAGLTEAAARQRGIEPLVGRFPFAASGRALTQEHDEGFVKVVADRDTGALIGVHIIGPEAGNLIGEAGLALELGASAEDLALTIHAHPTLPEALVEAAEAALGRPIHVPGR